MSENTASGTGNSRPKSLADVPSFRLEGRHVSTVYVAEFDDCPEMLVAYGEFVRAAKSAGYIVDGGSIRRFMSEEDLQKVLLEAQETWDRTRQVYERAARGEAIESYQVASLKQWCAAEGVDVPAAVSAVKA